ncbi:helicase-associated domain-containing protein [Plantibacter sp. VKM Ac-2880]|uniref:helicase-associated domain-containing protein n=1 Tax=Plantibacter sp. VKM Ac-2880 TaxID=2783827 RepID=UPI00188EFB25|nr:helicase-associated domain-containing protein [Plantibacter sp. VKM Ac-2880]MBF4568503.1 helicase-associated domain-containing protein [Plantibacter sp. VKM Ac-2880]
MGEAFAIARRLRDLPDDALRGLLADRKTSTARIGDFFDLAEALLDDASVARRMALLDRDTLAVLAAASVGSDRPSLAARLGRSVPEVEAAVARLEDAVLIVVDDEGSIRAVRAVESVFDGWAAAGEPSRAQLQEISDPPAPAPTPTSPDTDALASERAAGAVGIIGESLHELDREPARLLGRGAPSMPDLKRLAAAAASTPEQIELALSVASDAGLTVAAGAAIRLSEGGEDWLASTTSERWSRLATAWLEAIPAALRERILAAYGRGATDLVEELSWWYPLAGEAVTTPAGAVEAVADLLGVTAGGVTSGFGRLLIAGDPDGAAALLASMLPAEVSQVVLQDDLTVIALGPPTAELDVRLRSLAEPEGRAQASRYRITPESITRALADGDTAAGLLDYLESISLTGVPQPLRYLVSEAESRFGLVRVGTIRASADASADPGRSSYVRSEDAGLIAAVSVDQSLVALGLRPSDPNRLTSRSDAATVYWALHDARYPVVAEDDHGAPLRIRRQPLIRAASTAATSAPAPDLVSRLRADDLGDTSTAWLAKQLEVAVRDHTPVTVRLQHGERRSTFTIEPVSLAGGRLRGLDRAADVERTLPLAMITEVRVAG